MINVLSLFDGISCGQVALERAGIKVDNYFASEIDKYAISVTQKNYPNTIQLGDVNNFEIWELPKTDLLIGGSPCQDLSIAKKDRKGLDGERSGLFWRYVDCLKKFKPKYFLLENVASMPKEAKQIITDTLGVEPILINSALVSAQQRKRLYWTNIPGIAQPEDRGILLRDILESGVPYLEKCQTITSRYWGAEIKNSLEKNQRTMIAEPVTTSHYVGEIPNDGYRNGNQPSQQYRIFDVNAKHPSLNTYQSNIAEPVIIQRSHGFNKGGIHKEKSPTLTSGGAFEQNNFVVEPKLWNFYNNKEITDKSPALTSACGCLTSSSSVGKVEKIGELNNGGQGNRIYSVRGKSVCLSATSGGVGGKTGLYKIDLPDGDYIIRKLTPIECERLQTLPDNYTQGISNTQRYKCLGNGWTVDVIAHIFNFLPKEWKGE